MMKSVYNKLFVITTMIFHHLINGSKNLAENISPDDHCQNLIPIEEWFRKVSDPKFDCNPLTETQKIGKQSD